ncbi:Putative HTH-type transcriptional regulator [Nonomuraea coxensis DSM 45129]|uniref:HTH-type transcriptional regulator n=1 Tax=Nonomuraea coxensis DSM 45129 TaxID=1122611 RepID=A0ABX8U6H0_9ACTN|nr:BTAD domain-containing putative transcriptional regulator [Nonomuraea coxensis]QYC42268.1 Putative HTH-type transcriptional regulator [Nonomuraea coxensis DSM 45129]
MRVGILGPIEVESAAVGGARLRLLLARLALAGGRAVTAEELAGCLWPDDPPADPGNALQSLVSRLRRALPRAGALVSVPGGYRLDAGTDAEAFDRLAAEARRRADPAVRDRLLTEALALWRGPALGELAALPFAAGHAVRLEEARLAAVEDRAEARLALHGTTAGRPPPGRPAPGLRASEPPAAGLSAAGFASEVLGELAGELGELAGRHPLRERLHALRVRALHAAGRRAEALAAYEECRRALAAELGTGPGPELREAHLEVLRAEPPRPRRTNLRAPLTSFVGRDAELARVRDQLRAGRLVTLVGPGGAGKTRLATTAAAALLAEHTATWLVELAAVTDPDDVPRAVLSVLGDQASRHPGVTGTVEVLAEALSPGRVLLVLDNCEHVADAAARLAEELLGRCPRLRVLATSREPLSILGETLSPVPPLPPEPAVRLLADRAAAIDPALVLDADVAGEICRRLDGLPLAIELAAARLRALTPRELADRLGDRFLLLTGGSRTALPRHRTLRAVVAWSWDLLDDGERGLAERLAVFAGGFDLAAVEGAGGTLDQLAALVDKSLVQAAGPGRHRMLETIREYGLERLADAGRLAEARARHAAHYRDLAERAEPRLRGPDQLAWIGRLLADHDNILTALRHAAGTGDADTALRLAAAMGMFWVIRGFSADSAAWIERALALPGPAPRQARLVASAVCLINAALAGGNVRAEPALRELRLAVGEMDPEPEHPVLAMLEPALALFTDDSALGMEVIGRRLSHPDPWTRGMLYVARAALKENDGDMAGSREDLLSGCEHLRVSGERWGLSMALTSLAETHAVFGAFDAALAAMAEAMTLLRELDPEAGLRHQQGWRAQIRVRQGDVERARAELRAMLEPDGSEPTEHDLAFAHLGLGDLARVEGEFEAAERSYERATELLERSVPAVPQLRALVLVGQAQLAVARGTLKEAAGHVAEAVELTLPVRDMPVLARSAVAVAALRAAQGAPERAAALAGAAERLRGAPDAALPDVARLVSLLRARLGAAGYAAAHARGLALSPAEAVALVGAATAEARDGG